MNDVDYGNRKASILFDRAHQKMACLFSGLNTLHDAVNDGAGVWINNNRFKSSGNLVREGLRISSLGRRLSPTRSGASVSAKFKDPSHISANYLKSYTAIKQAFPDIKVISNCDGSNVQLDHPADLYHYHLHAGANTMFSMAHKFDRTSRTGQKAFVSEYVVTYGDARLGNLLAALAEAGFHIGL